MYTIKPRFFREPCVIFTILLLLHIAAEVHSATCPTPCNCTFSDTKYGENVAICDWENSSINITTKDGDLYEFVNKYSIAKTSVLLSVNITCQGTTHSCEDLPQFDISATAFHGSLYLTSCDSSILRCVNHIYPNMRIIKDIGHYNTRADTRILGFTTKGGVWQLYPNMFKGMTADYVIFDSNGIDSLPDDVFVGAKWSYLKIANTNIENITKNAFRDLKTLETVVLVKNKKLKSIDPDWLSGKNLLEMLEIRTNAIEFLPNDFLGGLESISQVYIEDNLVELRLDSQVFASTSLFYLSVTNSKLLDLPENLLSQSNALERVNFGYNLIKRLPAKLFWYTKSLTHVILRNNRIEVLPEGLFANLMYLKGVDLRSNNIVKVAGSIFSISQILDTLRLDYNSITELDLNNVQAFRIKTLSLASNKIKSLTAGGTLDKIRLAQEINLFDNDISVFEYLPISPQELKKLNISRNKISNIKESDLYLYQGIEIDFRFNNISDLINDSNRNSTLEKALQLYLSNNPFQYNCEVTTVLKKMNINGMLRDSDQITFEDGQNLANVKLYSVCESNETLIATIGIWTLGAIIALIVIIAIVRGRNTIRENIRNICNRNNTDTPMYQIRYDEIKTYDIFISFAHKDTEFVTDVMLPKLEDSFCQKVCVHYRDWVVGERISDQIIKSVENSRMTVIILSEHFLESEWSNLEFRTAHSLGTQDGTKLVIIVMDEGVIRNDKMTPELKSYIVINEHLLWSDFNFWEKLQKKLPRQGRSNKGKTFFKG